MSLFSKPKTPKNDPEFVLQVINNYGLGAVDPHYLRGVEALVKENQGNRIATLKAAAQTIADPTSPKELYAVSKAYVWAGASCRKEAIEALTRYIKVGAYYDGLPSGDIHIDGKVVSQKNANIAAVYSDLGQAYEGEYQYEDALAAYNKASEIMPFWASNYVKAAGVLSKLNRIDESISLLKKARPKVANDDRAAIDKYLTEMIDKKAQGYVYRPRKSKA